jgi:inorganic pyrophosphatase
MDSSFFMGLEESLLDCKVRNNPFELPRYISPDFMEFTSSGRKYRYTKGDSFAGSADPQIRHTITDFESKCISPGCYLVLYTITLHTLDNSIAITSNRSSIWKNEGTTWKIIFHQGTPVKLSFSNNRVEYWKAMKRLIDENGVVIDRKKHSTHPNHPNIVYPIDYGYIANSVSMDGNEIDIFRGSETTNTIQGIMVTLDTIKNDSEIKVVYNCAKTEVEVVLDFLNGNNMNAIFIPNIYDNS